MLVFWWTGRGYLTPVIVVATFSAFGLMLPIGGPLFKETPVYWGAAAVIAASIVWFVGRRVNANAIAAVRSTEFRHKLFYRARHKFMSLPLEIWSLPLATAGVVAIVKGMA